MAFWDNYDFLCRGFGKTPTGVGLELGISRSVVSAWKNSKRVPRADVLTKISRYFNVSAEKLVCGSIEDMFFVGTEDFEKDEGSNISRCIRIPVYGRVAAGIPIEAITDITDFEDISEEMARNGEYIALKIHGNSMQPRMCENDVIIVRKQDDVENGDTAVVFVNGGDATCKKIKKMADGIMLVSTNPEYEPMYYTNKQINDLPIRILGKVVEIRCKL